MRKLATVLPLTLLLGACSTFTWQGRNAGLTEGQRERGVKSIDTLVQEYESENYWRGMRRTIDGRTNALSRDLGNISATIDRHFFNYSSTDPYVNFETNQTYFTGALHQGGSFVGVNTLPWLPVR
jgi:hypothetical protein